MIWRHFATAFFFGCALSAVGCAPSVATLEVPVALSKTPVLLGPVRALGGSPRAEPLDSQPIERTLTTQKTREEVDVQVGNSPQATALPASASAPLPSSAPLAPLNSSTDLAPSPFAPPVLAPTATPRARPPLGDAVPTPRAP